MPWQRTILGPPGTMRDIKPAPCDKNHLPDVRQFISESLSLI